MITSSVFELSNHISGISHHWYQVFTSISAHHDLCLKYAQCTLHI